MVCQRPFLGGHGPSLGVDWLVGDLRVSAGAPALDPFGLRGGTARAERNRRERRRGRDAAPDRLPLGVRGLGMHGRRPASQGLTGRRSRPTARTSTCPGVRDDTVVDYKRDAATGRVHALRVPGRSRSAGASRWPGSTTRVGRSRIARRRRYLYVVSTGYATDGKFFVFQRVGDNAQHPGLLLGGGRDGLHERPRPSPSLPRSPAPIRSSPATTRCTSRLLPQQRRSASAVSPAEPTW